MLLSFCHHSRVLLALVTILAQSLLTLVGSHLVTLLFLSVWHNLKFFINYLTLFLLSVQSPAILLPAARQMCRNTLIYIMGNGVGD